MKWFYEFTEAEAESWRSYVDERQPGMLADLADMIRLTGGPLNSMDGSLGSLVPLWKWFVDYALAGCPGLRPDIQSMRFRALSETGFKDQRPYAAAERLEHYIFMVVRNAYPDAHWDVLRAKTKRNVDIHHLETGIRFAGKRWGQVGYFLVVLVGGIPTDARGVRSPDTLKNAVEAVFGPFPESTGNRTGDSLEALSESTSASSEIPDGPVFASPRRTDPAASVVRTELVLAPRNLRLGHERIDQRLDPGSVLALLEAIGIVGVDLNALASDGAEFAMADLPIIIQVRASAGRLLALMFSVHDAPEFEWNRIREHVEALAPTLGARFDSEATFT